ncbi:hypothetical protein WCD74_11640 [Actinomycetospora sp. OC33-EN08]|uniref:Uncharacterized protein n=1 Tax=Actinomycetospora aurantiaca TaxID=3129233 RepID=A0ABU8MM95_9PSEU
MARNKAEKNKALVFENETDKSSSEAVVNAAVKRVDYTKPDPKSGKRRPYGGTGEGNPKHANVPQERRCGRRRRKDGRPCQRLPMTGAEVCYVHGGAAEQTVQAALTRARNASVRLMQAEIDIALDPEQPSPVRLAAVRDLLDRAGAKSSDKVELEHSMKPWERVLAEATRVDREAPAPNLLDPAIQELQEEDDRY